MRNAGFFSKVCTRSEKSADVWEIVACFAAVCQHVFADMRTFCRSVRSDLNAKTGGPLMFDFVLAKNRQPDMVRPRTVFSNLRNIGAKVEGFSEIHINAAYEASWP